MRRLAILVAVVLCVVVNTQGQIVRNNSTATSEDSLAIEFWLADSLGQPTPIDTTGADSAWIAIYYPGGDTAFSDEIRLARVEPGVRLSVPVPGGGVRSVQYRRKVSDIDGNGVNGVYTWVIYARDSSLKLWSPFRGTFQVYTSITHTFANSLDSVSRSIAWEALDTLKTYDDANKLHKVVQWIGDSVQKYDDAGRFNANAQAILDSIQTWDNAGKLQPVLQSILDTLKLYDDAGRFNSNVQMILDTLRVYDDAGRFNANAQAILDTLKTYDDATKLHSAIQAILDTLRTYDDAGKLHKVVQEVLDTLKLYDNAGRFNANVQAILDTLKLYDDAPRAVVLAANGSTIDTLLIRVKSDTKAIFDSLDTQSWWATAAGTTPPTGGQIADSVWNRLTTTQAGGTNFQAGSFAKALQIDSSNIKAILDSIQLYDNAGRFNSNVQMALDTLRAYDDAGRFNANVQAILDSIKTWDDAGKMQIVLQSVLDSLKTYDDAGKLHKVVQQILDTLQVYDNAGRFNANTKAIFDTIVAHAPHGDDWGQGAGTSSDPSTYWRDTLEVILTAIKAMRDSGQYYAQTGSGSCPDSATIDAIVSGVCVSGSGTDPVACSLYVKEGSAAISGVRLFLYNSTKTAVVYLNGNAGTDINGLSVFGIAASTTYKVLAFRPGYTYDSLAVYQTLTSPGSGKIIDTIPVTAIPVGTPAVTNLCRVTGHVYNSFGNKAPRVLVCFSPTRTGAARVDDRIIIPTEKCVPTDQNGDFQIDLERASGVVYPGSSSSYAYKVKVIVPTRDQGSVECPILDSFTVPDSTAYSLYLKIQT